MFFIHWDEASVSGWSCGLQHDHICLRARGVFPPLHLAGRSVGYVSTSLLFPSTFLSSFTSMPFRLSTLKIRDFHVSACLHVPSASPEQGMLFHGLTLASGAPLLYGVIIKKSPLPLMLISQVSFLHAPWSYRYPRL